MWFTQILNDHAGYLSGEGLDIPAINNHVMNGGGAVDWWVNHATEGGREAIRMALDEWSPGEHHHVLWFLDQNLHNPWEFSWCYGNWGMCMDDEWTTQALENLIINVNLVSEIPFSTKPAYKSFTIEELEIKTKAARVDIDADTISNNMRTDSDSGITLANNSGISTSKTGFPFTNAAGAFSGDKNSRVVAPVKYAIPHINIAKQVEAIIPILMACLSLIA